MAHERGTAIVMTFAVERTVAQVIHNFQVTQVYADDFFNCVLCPEEGFVEMRTNQQTARRFARTWLAEFAAAFELEARPVTLTEADFVELKQDLGAVMVRYWDKLETGGSMDTIEVTVSPTTGDLWAQTGFLDTVSGSEQLLGDLRFVHDSRTYTIRVARTMGSIYFVKPAPESAIEQVRETLRLVKIRNAH